MRTGLYKEGIRKTYMKYFPSLFNPVTWKTLITSWTSLSWRPKGITARTRLEWQWKSNSSPPLRSVLTISCQSFLLLHVIQPISGSLSVLLPYIITLNYGRDTYHKDHISSPISHALVLPRCLHHSLLSCLPRS